jgi:predicted nucleotidyltransferase
VTAPQSFLSNPGPGHTLIDLAAFRREAMEILDLYVDVATPDMLKERIRDEALREALPL